MKLVRVAYKIRRRYNEKSNIEKNLEKKFHFFFEKNKFYTASTKVKKDKCIF